MTIHPEAVDTRLDLRSSQLLAFPAPAHSGQIESAAAALNESRMRWHIPSCVPSQRLFILYLSLKKRLATLVVHLEISTSHNRQSAPALN